MAYSPLLAVPGNENVVAVIDDSAWTMHSNGKMPGQSGPPPGGLAGYP